MQISVRHAFRAKRGSLRCAAVMDSFGIGFERGAHVIAEGLELPVRPGQVVLFTGASGSGKSSLMRAVVEKLGGEATSRADARTDEGAGVSENLSAIAPLPGAPPGTGGGREEVGLGIRDAKPVVIDINALDLGDATLIDSFDLPVSETMHLLSSCGLGEAHLMLRTPAELSDGQRYRFRLALGLAARPRWLVADEFTATLDRTLAKVVAHNLRKQCDRTGIGFLLATTHEDVAVDLDPDVHVQCRLDGKITVVQRGSPASGGREPAVARSDCKKKECCRSATSCGSAVRPNATGRTSLGGITAATTLV